LHAKTTSHVQHGTSTSKAYHHHHPQQQQQQAPHLHHHHRGAEGSPLSPPPPLPSQSPVPRSPTLPPTATFMLATSPPPVSQQTVWMTRSQPQHHVQPHHHSVIQHQGQHSVTGVTAATTDSHQGMYHSDSGEWTEFASAPYGIGGQDSTLAPPPTVVGTAFSEGFTASHSTPALCTLTSSGSGGLLAGGHSHHHQQQQLGGSQPKVGGADLSEFDPIAASSSAGPSELHQTQPPFKHKT
jgi:hypothetical protein